MARRLFAHAQQAHHNNDNADGFERRLLRCMGAIEGPFSFLYWHDATKRLYFGRDYLGRRSLMIEHRDTSPECCTIASVAYPTELTLKHGWRELLARRIFSFDLSDSNNAEQELEMHDLGELRVDCFGAEQVRHASVSR